MAYQANIPQPTDTLSDSQNDILQNFITLNTAWNINHVTFDLGDQGKHTHVSLPEQGAAPATAVNERAIYTKQSALTGLAELFTRVENSGAEVEFTSSLGATPGWTILPSGILLKWGESTGNGLTTITFPVAGTVPAFTEIYSIIVSTSYNNAADGDGFVRLNNFAAPWTQFVVYASQRTAVATRAVNFQYLTIGS